MKHIQPLPQGKLDIVGDIHGEISALTELLSHLGYDENGQHPENRTLVFIGDFVDRGLSSPAVIRLVQKLMRNGRAVAVLGNHELSVLINDAKSGSSWWFSERIEKDLAEGYGKTERLTDPQERQQALDWLASLPLALEREDLRVVHAAWHQPSIEKLRHCTNTTAEAYQQFEQASQQKLLQPEFAACLQKELDQWEADFDNPKAAMPMLEAVTQKDVDYQMNNPVRILTSGTEEKAAAPFFASNKWRFCNRGQWWQDYDDNTPVVIGHYSRSLNPEKAHKKDAFEGYSPTAWVGKNNNVFCVDYAVGYRHLDRKKGITDFRQSNFKLAALRWPERTLMFDNGHIEETE